MAQRRQACAVDPVARRRGVPEPAEPPDLAAAAERPERAHADIISGVHEWSPEVTVDERLARTLIAGQFPAVELRTLQLLGEGWDNSVWLADDRWVFRFPRRTIALPGFEREIAVLPELAPRLPLPIPAPVFVGRPADEFPWPFFGCELIRGREAAVAGLDDAARRRVAGQLGAFVRALHATDVAAELPVDPFGRTDMAVRVPRAREQLAEAERLGLWRVPESARRWLGDALELPPPEATAVVHGDLHIRHVIVGDGGAVAGVIDWGDLARADPSSDLSLYWTLLPADARPAFIDAYGPVSEERLLRARVLALFLSAVLALYAHHEGMPALEREAVAGLTRACAG
jgi:aminoglycoside phosphotransferase (APT) family kinase protein